MIGHFATQLALSSAVYSGKNADADTGRPPMDDSRGMPRARIS